MDMRLVQIGVEVLRRQNSVVSVMTLYEKTKFETTCMSGALVYSITVCCISL
jgi:hypothetical protein